VQAIDCWTAYVDRLPWCPGQLDEATFKAFLRAGSLGIEQQTAFDTVAQRIKAAEGRIRPRKIESQLERAYRYAGTDGKPPASTVVFRQLPSWPDPDPSLIANIAGSGFGLCDLAESSPIGFDDADPHTEEIVDALFPGNPLLCVGRSSSRFWTARRDSFRGQLSGLQFIVSSPMISLEGPRKEDGKMSAHALANTGPRRYLVIEFDHGPQDQQAALVDYLAQRGPLVLVVYSGGRSLHAWFHCQRADDSKLFQFMSLAVRIGADPHTWQNKSQFVRMPDGQRSDGLTRQRVYYFNPRIIP
jgi:hypothetical protein